MPVEIKLTHEHRLEADSINPNLLHLPTIELQPTRAFGNPYLVRITPEVSGIPSPLADVIKAAYNTADYSDKPAKLVTAQEIPQSPCRWNRPIPKNINGKLQITVEYRDQSRAPIQQVQAVCRLVSPTVVEEVVVDSSNGKTTDTYPGWFAIDFGTCNSTVTLYDPSIIETPRLLPSEQHTQLCQQLIELLDSRPIDLQAHTSQAAWNSEWQKFIQDICSGLAIEDEYSSLGNYLFGRHDLNCQLLALQQIELSLSKRLDWFRRAMSQRINQIYHQAFRVPPLKWQSLSPVILDQTRKREEIPSELEVTQQSPSVQVILGEDAKINRRMAIAQGEDIHDRFRHSPKRYLGQKEHEPLLQAAYAYLIQQIEAQRQQTPDLYSRGEFFRAVMTYPTVASPAVRRGIEAIIKQSFPNIKDVVMRYDEAVAVALFFLWKEFGGSLNVGIEAFKTRCQAKDGCWWQNVLVLDIGGGTTDLALLRLTLEDISDEVFKPGEDRGDGGRYYKLTPELLRSSGNLDLGGEQITLKIFGLLKVMIVDRLLTMQSDGQLTNAKLKLDVNELSDSLLENGRYRTGKLVTQFLDGNKEETLKFAERAIPTQWKEPSCKDPAARLDAFYCLWDLAEEAKITLGRPRSSNTDAPMFVPSPQSIAELLKRIGVELSDEEVETLNIELTVRQFEAIAVPIIRKAVKLAKGLVESALSGEEKLDRFILSGKTCKLGLVTRELHQEFSKSDRFTWNQDRVTFEPDYSKLATSAGACLAEKLYQLRFVPRDSIELLRSGVNQLYIDVKNLFYSLPCSFVREVAGDNPELPIFEANDKLYQLEAHDDLARRRSQWYGVQLSNNVRRKDFEDGERRLWGFYNGYALMLQLGMSETEFLEHIKVQFEINQKHDIDLLLCYDQPHYIVDLENGLDITPSLESQKVLSEDGRIKGDICVNRNVLVTAGSTEHRIVFDQQSDYSEELKTFRSQAAPQVVAKGLIAELPPPPQNGKYSFFLNQGEQLKFLGELLVPIFQTENSCKYYVSLSETGILQVHAFEVPYWTSTDIHCLKQPGCVYKDALQPQKPEDNQDPFCGKH